MPHDTISTSIFDQKARQTLEWKLHWVFRLALCCEFVSHGAFGVLAKRAWVTYFEVFGIPENWAWNLMPVVGCVDIALGTLALMAPVRAALLYMSCWGLFSASLRPPRAKVGLIMRKPNLLRFYEAAGLGGVGVPLQTIRAAIGGFELFLGAACLEVQAAAFLMFICLWKLVSEFLHVPAQAYGAWWEVIERGSSYAAPLLWIGFQRLLMTHGEAAYGVISRCWPRVFGTAARLS